MSFRKGVLADSCRGFNLAMPSSSVSYHEYVPNRACQEGRKSVLSLIGFRKIHLSLSTLYGHACFSLSCPCGRTMFECILVLSYFLAVSF